ncbi:hypothetical protein [Chryseobacterium cheonjiense]|uniref:Outer membrane protein beta-barrel domain-containing protein n=1 Tax=Chryseobacterium cheonjiense TaxID=2728845 RepID=A0A7Y0A4C8_9FLAO|nr:hypothetical protein [Chryseobacterium cheonjiense]NML56417.1 hypothetical protein [Chryseobacterium cheonjiense]
MKRLLIIFALISFSAAFSQEAGISKQTMGFYFNPSLNLGFKLNKEKEAPNTTQYIQTTPPRKFTYGITAIGGYNFLPNFALGTGFRYSFIEDNYHLIYLMVQPKFIFDPGDRPFYVELNYGKQLNHAVVSDAEFWGARLGIQVSYSKRISQEGGIFLESHKLGNSNPFFVGISYGVTIFSNKNYTGYGED